MTKVLIVDDSPMMRELMGKIVQQRECESDYATNYEESMQKFKEFHPDIVLLDIIMDDNKKTGMYALKEMKEQNPDTVIAMVTSISDLDDIIQECIEYGANEYVSKPFKESQILNILDSYMQDSGSR